MPWKKRWPRCAASIPLTTGWASSAAPCASLLRSLALAGEKREDYEEHLRLFHEPFPKVDERGRKLVASDGGNGGARVGGATERRAAIDGGTEPVSRPMVTLMVHERKLTGGVMRHFHHPWCHFGAKPVLQTNGISERVSVFGRFWGYQILPNFTNFYQKCVVKGARRGSKRQLRGGLWRAIYLNRVKSLGSCQAVTGAAWFQNRREP